jgi:hypothetical protein
VARHWIPRQLYVSTQYSAQTHANGFAMQCKQQGSSTLLHVVLFSLRQQTAWPVADDCLRLCWWCLATQFCSDCCEVVAFVYMCTSVYYTCCTHSLSMCECWHSWRQRSCLHALHALLCEPSSVHWCCCSFCGGPQGCFSASIIVWLCWRVGQVASL